MLRAAAEAVDCQRALEWLEAGEPGPHGDDTRLMASALLLDHARADAALRWAEGDEPALGIARARAQLVLGRVADAAQAYARA